LVVDWNSKEENARTIWEKLRIQFRDEGPAYSSVTNWLRRLGVGENIREPGNHPGKPSDDLIGLQILTELTEFPFHSIRTLAHPLKIPPSTVCDHLRKRPFVVKHLRWASQTLDAAKRRTRVTMSEGLFKDREHARHQGQRYFLTGDESWFFDATNFE
jgi:hypothetical protein